jgi:hypothetical protein
VKYFIYSVNASRAFRDFNIITLARITPNEAPIRLYLAIDSFVKGSKSRSACSRFSAGRSATRDFDITKANSANTSEWVCSNNSRMALTVSRRNDIFAMRNATQAVISPPMMAPTNPIAAARMLESMSEGDGAGVDTGGLVGDGVGVISGIGVGLGVIAGIGERLGAGVCACREKARPKKIATRKTIIVSFIESFGFGFTSYEGSGWAGIRTPGAFRHTRFPGVHNRPLCHPSVFDL